jgi:2-dehydro-3-deoxygluconokinase
VFTMGEALAVFASSRTGPLRTGRSFELRIAGSESNVAIGLARLGHTVAWVGRIGDDELGQAIRRELRAEGVDTTGVVVDGSAPTALMIKERRTADVSRVAYYRGGSAGSHLMPADVPTEVVTAASLTHLSGITAALSESALDAAGYAATLARSADRLISFDVNYRSALWSRSAASTALLPLVRAADLLFVAHEDLAMLSDEVDPMLAPEALSALGPRQVIVTRGRDGAVGWIDGERYVQPALPVTTVDPVGAGDAFAAGYLAAMMSRASPEARLRQGAAAAALVVGVDGDWEGFPSAAELELVSLSSGHVRR